MDARGTDDEQMTPFGAARQYYDDILKRDTVCMTSMRYCLHDEYDDFHYLNLNCTVRMFCSNMLSEVNIILPLCLVLLLTLSRMTLLRLPKLDRYIHTRNKEYDANVIAENMLMDVDDEGYSQTMLEAIVDFQKDEAVAIPKSDKYVYSQSGQTRKRVTTQGWKLLVKW
eukprot:CAMPEP_0194067604 /NCGR_PEP_ID=MMETSP0009_2-20130614/86631_1 /TAXON_ID=210454 /ORGANISM="Grammatophora oceanica, Strain CCMP 410" /LENGTH=168 /DNA_ID=CAMNT_0038720637 /DNA_START=5606 /DNA_END=6110 /DNA_ORIENTATION=-